MSTPHDEFRRAIADEMATIRAINAALRGPIAPEDADILVSVRRNAVQVMRDLLITHYAFDRSQMPQPVHKPPRSARRSPRSGHA